MMFYTEYPKILLCDLEFKHLLKFSFMRDGVDGADSAVTYTCIHLK